MSSLRKFAGPLVGAAVILLLAIPYNTVMLVRGGEISRSSSLLYSAAFSMVIVWAVKIDRRWRGDSAPFQYDELMFFLWVVLLPHYLFRARSWRGLWLGIGILLMVYLLPYLAALAVWLIVA